MSRLLAHDDAHALGESHGHAPLAAALRAVLESRRDALSNGEDSDISTGAVLADARTILEEQAELSLRPVFNLTGTVLHTNLGRAFLPDEAIEAVAAVTRGASNLEYDLTTGKRGDRDDHIDAQIVEITGAEAATVVNNNAAAVMLVLNSLAMGRDVAVSRGELVEIGGSFRIPDIMARSGCRLVEVGTTNRTHLKDFESAIGPDLAMIMKVHTSNYVIEGFTKAVPETELAELGRAHGIPFVNDLGSGTLANLEDYGLPHEPTPMDALRDGADIVTFSGDKLLGGPQAGIIVGRKDLVAKIKSNPMKRAMRCDKMTIAALSAVLKLYRDPGRLADRVPVIGALTRKADEIRRQAEDLLPMIADKLGKSWQVEVAACESEIGSGALPTRTIASAGITMKPTKARSAGTRLNELAVALRSLPQPVIGRIHDGALILDLRCLRDADRDGFVSQLSKLETKP